MAEYLAAGAPVRGAPISCTTDRKVLLPAATLQTLNGTEYEGRVLTVKLDRFAQ